jgi:hypothetical protein
MKSKNSSNKKQSKQVYFVKISKPKKDNGIHKNVNFKQM